MRNFPIAACALALAMLAAACSREPANQDARLYEVAAAIGQREVSLSPELATSLGLPDEVFGRPYATLLDDRSMAAAERQRLERLEDLETLSDISRARLTREAQRLRDTLLHELAATVEAGNHGYGRTRLGLTSPYLITPWDGAYVDVVKLLLRRQPIRSREDADAWLARLRALPQAMTDERRRFALDIDSGAAPPRIILDKTLAQARALAPTARGEGLLLNHLRAELAKVDAIPAEEAERIVGEAATLIEDELLPAYASLIELLISARSKSAEGPGAWRLPNGEDYYRDALRMVGGTDLSPEEVNDAGSKLIETYATQLHEALVGAGLPEGSIADRLATLSTDPRFVFPEGPEGQAGLIAVLDSRRGWARSQLSKMVSTAPKENLGIRIAETILPEKGSGAWFKASSVDGARPASMNLRMGAVANWPIWLLPTLAFHEMTPGHDLQASVAALRKDVPLVLRLAAFPSYSEGWGVYAEDLAAELGAYTDDPFGRIGYLQSLLLRSARMVLDVGLHSERWTYDEAVSWMSSTAGISVEEATEEVDRCIVRPGLCASYMLGREKIRYLRNTADSALGPAFDLPAFHDLVLAYGPRPLQVVEQDVQDWIAAALAPPAAQ